MKDKGGRGEEGIWGVGANGFTCLTKFSKLCILNKVGVPFKCVSFLQMMHTDFLF